MSLSDVILNQLDNQIGIQDPGGKRLAIVGDSSAGPVNTPGIYARKADIISTFVSGSLVEDGCYALETTGKPVVLCKTGVTTAAAYGSIDDDGVDGTSAITADAVLLPDNDYEIWVKFPTGGTIGVDGITYQYSLDDGRDGFSVLQSLGTAATITLPGGATFDFAAGTIVAGDFFKCRTTGPAPNQVQLAAALEALRTTENDWWIGVSCSPALAVDVATLDAAGTALELVGKERLFITGFRVPNIGETEAQYLTAFQTAFSASVSTVGRVLVCAGSAEIQSPISQRRYLRRITIDCAAAHIAVRPGQDISWVGAGPRPPTVRIKDAAGNLKHHDELYNPGLEAARATTYRTWEGERGVFFGNPVLMTAPGSDFLYSPARLVMNVAREVTRRRLQKFSSLDVLVNKKTGYILEEAAADIDDVINAALDLALLVPKDASDAVFRLSRTDNLLSTFTLRGDLKVTPLAYLKHIIVNVGFFNPALRAVYAEAA